MSLLHFAWCRALTDPAICTLRSSQHILEADCVILQAVEHVLVQLPIIYDPRIGALTGVNTCLVPLPRSSRKGTVETAQRLLEDSKRIGPQGRFVRDHTQHERLQVAAGRATSRQLQDVLQLGLGFHHAAMEPQDRALVEACFLDRSILVRMAH